jgi:hypothetical protein
MGFMTKVGRFARSPQGQKAIGEAKRLAKDPKTRKQLDDLRRRFAKPAGGRKP